MARCGCSGNTCSCVVTGSGGISVTGTGTTSNPFIVSGGGVLQVSDTATVDLTLSGSGSGASPYQLSAAAVVSLDELTDVVATGGSTGYVLAKQGDGTFALNPPSTASPGAINVTGGIEGDGSAGSPLSIKLAPNSGLVEDSSGLKVSGTAGGAWTAYTPTLTADVVNPIIGNGEIAGRYSQTGKTVHFTMWIRIGSTTQRGSGYWSVTLPVTSYATGAYGGAICPSHMSVPGVGDWDGVSRIENGQLLRIWFTDGTKAHALMGGWPTIFGTGSMVHISGTYEAA